MGSIVVTSSIPMARTTSSNRSFPVRLVQQASSGTGVFLLPGHRRRSIIENQDDMTAWRRVVDHFGQPGQPAVHKGRVADDTDHPPRLLRRQHVPHTKADTDAGAHAGQGIHRRERRQHAKRIAADIARDDAIEPGQRFEDRAVRTAFAQGRRLAAGIVASTDSSCSRIRRTRSALSSPKRKRSDLPSTCKPSARNSVTRMGSPSSSTTQRPTEATNTRIAFIGKG